MYPIKSQAKMRNSLFRLVWKPWSFLELMLWSSEFLKGKSGAVSYKVVPYEKLVKSRAFGQ